MDTIVDLLSKIADLLWGPPFFPILLLIVGGGLIVAIRLGFPQITHFGYMMGQTFGRIFDKNHKGEGTVTPFQAACSALASSIGAANIVVVPSIIFVAGPGAVFWMWVAAIIGQSTKFSEIVLGQKYREQNVEGEYVGGPAYYLKKGIGGPIGKLLAFLVAFFFMIEILPSITVQTHAAIGPLIELGVDKIVACLVILVIVLLVVYGGIKRIGQVTELMVPLMAVVYFICALVIIVMNIQAVPMAFYNIFVGAFKPSAVAGGAVGATLLLALQKGVARGVYSNEAGMGSAPYAHSAAVIDHPVRQGFWGVFEVTVDTLIVCTMSALVVLVTGAWQQKGIESVAVYTAFTNSLGFFGGLVVSISLFFFVLSTIIVIVFYCEKQAEFLFGTVVGKIMRFVAVVMILVALFLDFNKASFFLDFTLALVIIPNMIGVVYLSGEVKELTKEFFSDPKYYEKIKK